MSVKDRTAHCTGRGAACSRTLMHRHYETFELPEVPDRLLPDRLAITFLTDRDGNIVSLSAPLEPMVKDIVFARLAAGDCTDPAFRARCVGHFKGGAITHRVTLDSESRPCAEARLPAGLSPRARAGKKVSASSSWRASSSNFAARG